LWKTLRMGGEKDGGGDVSEVDAFIKWMETVLFRGRSGPVQES